MLLSFDGFDGFKCGENICLAVVDGNGMLEMGCGLAVACDDAPAVGEHGQMALAHGYHGLDGDAEAILERHARPAASEVGHLRVFVHFLAYTVTDKLTDDAVAALNAVVLYGGADVAETFAGIGLVYAGI